MHDKHCTEHVTEQELKSLFKALNSDPCFKNPDPFLPSVTSEGFLTAEDGLNLLLSAPEEGKDNTHLEVLCQHPRGPHQKRILTTAPFGIST